MKNVLKNTSALLLGALILAFLVLGGRVNQKLVLVLLGSTCILFLLLNQQYRQNLLMLSILGFLTGWRGIDITPAFIVYPTELFIWVGLLIYLYEQISERKDLHPSRPILIEIVLVIFAVLGGITSLINGSPLLDLLAPLKSFLVFIPMLILFRSWIQDRRQIESFARLLVYVGVITSILGLLERYVPQVAALFPKYMYAPTDTRFNFGFGSVIELANFSSWGTPVVSTMLVLFTGLAIFLPNPQIGWQRILSFISLPVLIMAIIASGYRSAWLALVPVIVLGIIFNRKQALPWFISAIAGIFILFTQAFLDRFRTIIFITNSIDPTFLRRVSALQAGLLTIKNNPFFGTGWNSHTAFNDWVNLGVVMGIFGAAVFVIWYFRLLLKLLHFAPKSITRDAFLLHMAFFTALAGYSIAMFSGAMSQVYPIMTGFWFVFCLGWRLTEISQQEELANGQIVSIVTDI